MNAVFAHERAAILHGDSSGLAEHLPENSIDAIVTDPPSSTGFMNRAWDRDRGGFHQWTKWLADVLAPSLHALKPGGYALVWALPRTSHWTAVALELAGFEIRDVHHHIFGTGNPKTLDLARQIDMQLCALPGRHCDKHLRANPKPNDHLCPEHPRRIEADSMRTALKPSVEHWILARKPIEGKYAKNVLQYGTGGLNTDACRIGDEPRANQPAGNKAGHGTSYNMTVHGMPSDAQPTTTGRWPSHLSLQHSPDCEFLGEEEEQIATYENADPQTRPVTNFGMNKQIVTGSKTVSHEVYRCAHGCPVAEIEAARKGASKFFYCIKAGRKEKDAGLAHLPLRTGGEATDREDDSIGVNNPRAGAGRTGGARNFHPCSKSVALMTWLIRLITPPGGTVLDPFAGSGTTGVAALAEGFKFIGSEMTDDYIPILVGRIRHALGLPPEQPTVSEG